MNEAKFREAERALWTSKGASPSERVLPIPALGASVRVQELGEGPPVLFIHGGNVCGASWAGLAPRIQGFRCIVLDRPGCGLSEPLIPPPTVESLPGIAAKLVGGVLDALELESAHVVGTSFGGLVMLNAAAHPPGPCPAPGRIWLAIR